MYNSYDKITVNARECGDIDWRKIIDNTRRIIDAPTRWDNTKQFINAVDSWVVGIYGEYYIDLWKNQEYSLWLFVEKEGLSSIISEIALPLQVPVIAGRGYNSFTQLKDVAERFNHTDKPIVVLYFGDWDATGVDIDRSLKERLLKYGNREFYIERCALTSQDISEIPSAPIPKRKLGDSRLPSYYAKYGDKIWELDALPPDVLRNRVKQSIERFIGDKETWENDMATMLKQRTQVKNIISKFWIKGGK
jgi:hypothetical protein